MGGGRLFDMGGSAVKYGNYAYSILSMYLFQFKQHQAMNDINSKGRGIYCSYIVLNV